MYIAGDSVCSAIFHRFFDRVRAGKQLHDVFNVVDAVPIFRQQQSDTRITGSPRPAHLQLACRN